MTLSIGVAGVGVHGSRYVKHLLAGDVDGARLGAICRSDVREGRRFSLEHGVAYYPTVQELAAADGIDAVVAALPPSKHEEASLAAIDAGCPALIEKPLAAGAAAAQRVHDAVERTGAFLMVGQTLRFDPLLVRLRQERDGLGGLQMVSINQRFEPSLRPWLDTPKDGGLFLNTGVHGFDLIRWIMGVEVQSIVADARGEHTRQTEDQTVALLRMADGRLALLDNARSTRSRSGRVELIGADAQLWGDHVHRTLSRVEARERRELGPVAAAPTVPAALCAFVEALAADAPPPITSADGLAAVECVDAARLAAAEDRRVTLSEIRGRSD